MKPFSQTTFDWMLALSLDNSREQFLALKSQYEESVKQPFVDLLTQLSVKYGGTPKVFRPNRDVRFSNDKRPYKTNVSGYLEDAGSTYYLDLSVEGLMAATGYYQMGKDQLVRYRSALTSQGGDKLGDELREIIAKSGATGEGLKTVPRGVPKDHRNADLLRFKSLTASSVLPVERVLDSDLIAFATEVWDRSEPLNRWLSTHVGPSTEAW
jgi:uncharacterized protein (TIGR02453 family)